MKLLVKHGADPNIPTMAPREQVRRGGGPPPGGPRCRRWCGSAGRAGGAERRRRAVQWRRRLTRRRSATPRRRFRPAVPARSRFTPRPVSNTAKASPATRIGMRRTAGCRSMKYLVEELGADVNARDNDGYTPLHHAAARGDNEVILYLVSKGADVTAVARSGQTVGRHGQRPGAARVADSGNGRAAREARQRRTATSASSANGQVGARHASPRTGRLTREGEAMPRHYRPSRTAGVQPRPFSLYAQTR